MQIPDRRRDDALFNDMFPLSGDKTMLAGLMGVDAASVTQQTDVNNKRRSYFHCGKLALTAAYMFDAIEGGCRGETLWNDLSAWRDQLLGTSRAELTRFPSKLAFKVIYRETNSTPEELAGIPLGKRLNDLNALIADLSDYRDHLAKENGEYFDNATNFRGEDGTERDDRRGVNTPRPIQAAARR